MASLNVKDCRSSHSQIYSSLHGGPTETIQLLPESLLALMRTVEANPRQACLSHRVFVFASDSVFVKLNKNINK